MITLNPRAPLTEVLPQLSQQLRAAGLPESSGDGIPFVALALHQHAYTSGFVAPEWATSGAILGLALTLDTAECCAPGKFAPHLVRLYGQHHFIDPTAPKLAELAALALVPSIRQPRTDIHELMDGWTHLPADCDEANPAMLSALCRLAVFFVSALRQGDGAFIYPPFDPAGLLYPTRSENEVSTCASLA